MQQQVSDIITFIYILLIYTCMFNNMQLLPSITNKKNFVMLVYPNRVCFNGPLFVNVYIMTNTTAFQNCFE